MTLKWEKINDFLLICGSQRNPDDLGTQILNSIGVLIPFDQGRLYFLDGNGQVQREHLLGVKKKSAMEYHEYYSKYDDGLYSTPSAASWFAHSYPTVEQCIFSPASYGSSRFYTEYIKPQKIKHSFGLGLRSDAHTLKCLISLDRTCSTPYSNEEIETMTVLRPHLDNMLQNLYISLHRESLYGVYEDDPLTEREQEITKLLLDGVTPQNISNRLSISYTTVKKHLDHIYKKLHVRTRQELLLKLLKNETAARI